MTHIARAFDGDLFLPASAEGATPRLLQLPFLRILVQGRIGVSIFAFVTGYVCALKPIKLSRQGNQEAAFVSISKSALRRVPRLVIPTAFATCLIWVMAQFGFFLVAKRSDSWWSGATAPDQVPHLGDALKSLFYNIITTWTHGRNAYDGNQWTLLPLLKGSFWVYIFIFGTAYLQPFYRMICSLGMFAFFWIAGDGESFDQVVLWKYQQLTCGSRFRYAVLLGRLHVRSSKPPYGKRFHGQPTSSVQNACHLLPRHWMFPCILPRGSL